LLRNVPPNNLWAASGPAWNLAPLPAIHAGRHCRPRRCSPQSKTTKMAFPSHSHCASLEHPPSTNRGSYPGLPSPRPVHDATCTIMHDFHLIDV
jgi:hypothetical protein